MMRKIKRVAVALMTAGIVLSGAVATACGEPVDPRPPVGEEHVLTLVSAVDADCENGGNSAYYTCSHCDKLFADKDGGTETSLDKVTLPALGHDYDGYERDEAGHWQVCERCDETTQKQSHKAAQLDFGKSDQTCEQCGYVLNKALFAPLETPKQITVSKNMSGSSTVASREAGARKIDCNGQTVDGNFYAFTGKAGQYIIITGGGIRGGVGAKRELFGVYLENYGSTDIAVKYYLENSGAIPGSTDMLTVKAGETVYAEMIVDMQTFSSEPYSRIELGSDATDAKLGLACFRMGTLADGAYRLRLPDVFSDGTCDKLVTTELGNRLLSSVRLDVPSGALGFYNLRRPEQFWLGDVESTVNPVMDGDLVLCAMIARGEHKSVKVEPRATSGGAQPAISI
ncbi:MAG: hypothetical protein OSJ83_10870, partial [Clostridia bacterium]|nr:hypothetical protein [Clostridia bacterium]